MSSPAEPTANARRASGAPPVRIAEIRDTALSVDEVLSAVGDPAAGGIALFVGTVRQQDSGRAVTRLEYSAHPSAGQVLRELAERVAQQYNASAVAVTHRVGSLGIGELAVVAAVACPHRGEAFDACEQLVDELKHTVPLWKHQIFTDGADEWVGSA